MKDTDTPETEAGRKPNGIYCDYVHWTTCARIEQQRDKALAALKGLLGAVEKAPHSAACELNRDWRHSAIGKCTCWKGNAIETARALTAAAEPKAEGKG